MNMFIVLNSRICLSPICRVLHRRQRYTVIHESTVLDAIWTIFNRISADRCYRLPHKIWQQRTIFPARCAESKIIPSPTLIYIFMISFTIIIYLVLSDIAGDNTFVADLIWNENSTFVKFLRKNNNMFFDSGIFVYNTSHKSFRNSHSHAPIFEYILDSRDNFSFKSLEMGVWL